MGDTSIIYSDKFGINTFKREICVALGEDFWNELVEGIDLPDIDNECKCQCGNMQVFMKRLEEKADAEMVKHILYKVRHGLHPSQSAWAREKFLEVGDLDRFFQPYSASEEGIVCRKVQTKEDFRSWIEVVNTALHGWEMIDADNYYVWVENENIDLYLGKIDGISVSTAATIRNKDTASLEFVSTLEKYRRRKMASVVCSTALKNLFESGVEDVTLSACGESACLYEKFGFKAYFNNVIMRYAGWHLC